MTDMMEWFKEQKKLHRKCAYQVGATAPSSPALSAVLHGFSLSPLLQILVQVKDVLSKLPSLVEVTLKEVSRSSRLDRSRSPEF